MAGRLTLAVVIIGSEKRLETTLTHAALSVVEQAPDEFLVIAEGIDSANFPFFNVAPLTHTTIDALVKRDAGWAATRSDAVLFLCDDHQLAPDFVATYREKYEPRQDWDMLCPARYTVRGESVVPLPVGQDRNYIGGHAGIYRRRCARLLPWSAAPHHPNWDVLHTHTLIEKGAQLRYADRDLSVIDIEPGATPWI